MFIFICIKNLLKLSKKIDENTTKRKDIRNNFSRKVNTIGLDDKQADDYFENDCKCGL